GHEEGGVPLIEALCRRLRVPNDYRDLAVLGARQHANIHRAAELRADTLLKLLESSDAFRRPQRFAELLQVCESDARGRTGMHSRAYPQSAYLQQIREAAAAVTIPEAERAGLSGQQIGALLHTRRMEAIAQVREALRGSVQEAL